MPNITMLLGEVAAGGAAVGLSDFQVILDSLTSQFSVANIVAILAGVVGAAVGLVFMWWGARKLVSVIMKAVKSGKLRF